MGLDEKLSWLMGMLVSGSSINDKKIISITESRFRFSKLYNR